MCGILLGILRGNMYDLGDFDECLHINAPDQFEPRYWYERESNKTRTKKNDRFTIIDT